MVWLVYSFSKCESISRNQFSSKRQANSLSSKQPFKSLSNQNIASSSSTAIPIERIKYSPWCESPLYSVLLYQINGYVKTIAQVPFTNASNSRQGTATLPSINHSFVFCRLNFFCVDTAKAAPHTHYRNYERRITN